MLGEREMLENKWRRVPESNRCTRICNPHVRTVFQRFFCKRTPFVHDEKSTTYKETVNGFRADASPKKGKTVEGAATHLNGFGLQSTFTFYPFAALNAIAGGANV